MPLSLTCDCGARFEVEDALAGQAVACPECQQPLKAPSAQRPTVRTSGFALASFLLAIVGAFTVVGTVAAVVLGLVAFVLILRDRERLAGLGFASCGVALGLAFTALTLWSLSSGELFGLGATMRRTQMADQLEPPDPKAPTEVKENGFRITRPSFKWQRAKKDFQYMLVQPLLRSDALLLLVQPDLYAFLDVQVEADGRVGFIDDYIRNRLNPGPGHVPAGAKDKAMGNPAGAENDDEEPSVVGAGEARILSSAIIAADDGVQEAHELTVEQKVAGKSWTMLIRTYRTTGDKLFIVRGFAETPRFGRVREEITKALNSFKVAPGS